MKSLAEFSVKNPLLINLFSVFFVVMGAIAVLKLLNREAFPNINFDIVVVSAAYPGSTPLEIEKLITIPIEKELKQVDDIKEISSVSAEGVSRITLVIDEDARDKPAVVNDIQRAVDRVEDLPPDLPDKPVVKEMRTRDEPIIEVSLFGDGLGEDELYAHARRLEKRLLDLPDVSKITRKGYKEKEISVEVSPQSMWANYVGLDEISRALKAQNRAIPGGKFYENEVEYTLRTTGEFADKSDVEKTIVRAGSLGKWIRVSDVATVNDSHEEQTLIEKTRGRRAVTLVVVKKERGDAINLVDDVKAAVEEYRAAQGGALQVAYVNDLSFYIRRRLNVLINNGVIGLGLVAITLFIFLSPGAALSACLGIPTALLMTFTFMSFFGISINLISLFGLIMVLGMLVDEDIVVAENIHRHIETTGESSAEATVRGAAEVNASVVATVLTTIAAFVPLFFMGGIMGKFVRNIPVVVTLTLCCSLLEALVVLPSHISELTRKKKTPREERAAAKSAARNEKMLSLYRRLLAHGLRRRYAYSTLLVAVFAVSLYVAVAHMKFILFPSKGVEVFFVRVEGKVGDSLDDTAEKMKKLEAIIDTLPDNELDTYTTIVGLVRNDPNDPFTNRAAHVGQIQVYLTPETARTRTSQEISDSLRPLAEKIEGFERVSFDQFRNGPPVGQPIHVRLTGEDFSVLRKLAEKYKGTLRTIPGITDVRDDYDTGKHEKRVVIDPVRAAQAGLNVETVAMTVRQAFEGVPATSIKSTEEEIDIVVKFPPEFRRDPEALKKLMVPNGRGQLIPLDSVADFVPASGIQAVKHFDGDRNVNVTANVDEKEISVMQAAAKLRGLMPDIDREFPGYKAAFAGEAEDTEESLHNLFVAFFLASGLILMILVFMFKSLLQTAIVMLTIPFSIIGVILAFMAHGQPLSFMAILGLIGVTGIVVDGALLMIDFINKFRAGGMAATESILQGSALRLRAVALTSLSTVIGVIPSSYGIGGNDPFIAPMALALNYGIAFSTILTLFYIPLFIAIVDDVKELRRGPIFLILKNPRRFFQFEKSRTSKDTIEAK